MKISKLFLEISKNFLELLAVASTGILWFMIIAKVEEPTDVTPIERSYFGKLICYPHCWEIAVAIIMAIVISIVLIECAEKKLEKRQIKYRGSL